MKIKRNTIALIAAVCLLLYSYWPVYRVVIVETHSESRTPYISEITRCPECPPEPETFYAVTSGYGVAMGIGTDSTMRYRSISWEDYKIGDTITISRISKYFFAW